MDNGEAGRGFFEASCEPRQRRNTMNKNFEVTFLGTNGSCAYDNGKRSKYGTNTLCVAVKAGDEVIVLDAGTGICGVRDLPEYQSKRKHLFLSHYHMDHIDGLLFYSDLFDPEIEINIYGPGDVQAILHDLIAPPLCPVGPEFFKASIKYHTIKPGDYLTLPGDIIVKTCKLSHPGGALGSRIEYGGKSFCYCVDVELSNHKDDADLAGFFRDLDLLILDASFADGQVIPGWGHSCPKECARWAAETGVGKLALYHYNYTMTDEEIDLMEKSAKEIFPNTFTAADYMQMDL